jgi:hypothetical protein
MGRMCIMYCDICTVIHVLWSMYCDICTVLKSCTQSETLELVEYVLCTVIDSTYSTNSWILNPVYVLQYRVHSTYSTNAKVLNWVHDSSTVHISLYGNIQFRVHFVLVFAQPSLTNTSKDAEFDGLSEYVTFFSPTYFYNSNNCKKRRENKKKMQLVQIWCYRVS